jgi:WXXGXW repeat (2 copies)
MKHRILAGAFVLLGTLLAGCGVGYGYSSAYVAYAPPAPRYAVVGAAPGPGYVWIDGYWGWRGSNYAWIDGRWAVPPHGRRVWVRGEWRHEGHGWRYHEGRWR